MNNNIEVISINHKYNKNTYEKLQYLYRRR